MKRRFLAPVSKDRLRAVFLCALAIFALPGLSGCAGSSDSSLWGSTVSTFLPGHGDVSRQAEAISYASIDLSVGRRGGLLVLAEQGDGLTFWQSSNRETVVLKDGYLDSTSGLDQDLRMSAIHRSTASERAPWDGAVATPVQYVVTRSWRTAKGQTHSAQGQATLTCGLAEREMTLPLVTRKLEQCQESVDWDNGRKTSSVYWRDPGSFRIWAAEVVPWPGAPVIAWRVARPWW